MDQVAIVIPRPFVNDGDNFTVNAYFRDRASATADAPTTVEYRIDCLTTRQIVQDWTSVTAGESVAIALAGAYSAILNLCNPLECKQITIAGDRGDTFQAAAQAIWTVRNLNLIVA